MKQNRKQTDTRALAQKTRVNETRFIRSYFKPGDEEVHGAAMRLRRFEIHNFKGIIEASFEWSDLITLIGENNSGKSSVLQALDWFLSGRQIREEALFHNKITDEGQAIELIGYFDILRKMKRKASRFEAECTVNNGSLRSVFGAV